MHTTKQIYKNRGSLGLSPYVGKKMPIAIGSWFFDEKMHNVANVGNKLLRSNGRKR